MRQVVVRQAAPQSEQDGVPVYRKQILSPVYTIDRLYRSMTGPQSMTKFALLDGEPELVWIVGYSAVMRAADGVTPMDQQFMCHSNLNVDPWEHKREFPTRIKLKGGRLFTLSQGQLAISLPPGFGVPMMSDQELSLAAQVLNLNIEGEEIDVRHDIRIDFIRDRDLVRPFVPLIEAAVWGMKLVLGIDGYYGLGRGEADPEIHGPGCMLGPAAVLLDDQGNLEVNEDGQGRLFTGHWVVKPGREENHTLVTRPLLLPYDTTIHYIAVHLHPFAESLELYDLTARKTVYRSRTRQADRGIGLSDVEYFSSVEGLPIYKDHEYELISVYNNTSEQDQDSMATMLLFLQAIDLEFQPDTPARPAEITSAR